MLDGVDGVHTESSLCDVVKNAYLCVLEISGSSISFLLYTVYYTRMIVRFVV